MPAIPATDISSSGAVAVSPTTLDGTDSFTFIDSESTLQLLHIHNPTGGAISPTIVGDAAPSAHPVKGGTPVDYSSGYAVGSIAAGGTVTVSTDTIRLFCLDSANTPDITSGTGLEVAVLEKRVGTGWK